MLAVHLPCLLAYANLMPALRLHLHSQPHMRAGHQQLTKHHLADPSPSMRPHWRLITSGSFPLLPTSLMSQAICHHAGPDHTAVPKHCPSSNSSPHSFAATTLPQGQPQRTPRMQQAVHLSLFSHAMIGSGWHCHLAPAPLWCLAHRSTYSVLVPCV